MVSSVFDYNCFCVVVWHRVLSIKGKEMDVYSVSRMVIMHKIQVANDISCRAVSDICSATTVVLFSTEMCRQQRERCQYVSGHI